MNYKLLIGVLLVLICSVSACMAAEELTDFEGHFKMNILDGTGIENVNDDKNDTSCIAYEIKNIDYGVIYGEDINKGDLKSVIKEKNTDGNLTVVEWKDASFPAGALIKSTDGKQFVLVGGTNQASVNKMASSVVFN